MGRRIDAPTLDLTGAVLPVELGGTGATTAAQAAANLNLTLTSQVGTANNPIALDSNGKVPTGKLPSTSSSASQTMAINLHKFQQYKNYTRGNENNFNGAVSQMPGDVVYFLITDYDIKKTYTISALNGCTVSRSGNMIKVQIPTSMAVGASQSLFTINGVTVTTAISPVNSYVPQITSMVDGTGGVDFSSLTLSCPAFSLAGATIQYYAFRLAQSPDFSDNSGLSWTNSTPSYTFNNLKQGTTYYAQCYVRYTYGGVGYNTQVSETISFTTGVSPLAVNEEAKLTHSNYTTSDVIGQGISITKTGDRLIAGANGNQGAAYVFVRSGTTWAQEAKLVGSDTVAGDNFGFSVRFDSDGTRAVVGSYLADASGKVDSGAVYVFIRSGSAWTQEAKLVASDAAAGDNLGMAVSISSDGTRVIAGARGRSSYTGAAYIFSRSGTTWTQEATLVASDATTNDYFGRSVGMDASAARAVIGAYNKTVGANANQGASYIFVRTGTAWTQEAKLVASDGAAGDLFSYKVAIAGDGSRAAAGCYAKTVNGNTSQGAVYIFSRSGTTWTQEAKLVAPDGTAGDLLGFELCFDASGLRVAASAVSKSVGANTQQGAVYLFMNLSGSWVSVGKVIAKDGMAGDEFGSSVDYDGTGSRLAIGSRYVDIMGVVNVGSIYVESIVSIAPSVTATVQEESKIVAADGTSNNYFGFCCSMTSDGSRVLVSAYNQTVSSLAGAGSAYVFVRSGSTWTLEQKIPSPDPQANGYFGQAGVISQDGTRAIITASHKTVGANLNQGTAYVFTRSGSTWTQEAVLTASDGAASDYFGINVAIDSTGTRGVIGAYKANPGGVSDAGAAYVFTRTGTTWAQEAKLVASDPASVDYFGRSVAVDNTAARIVVGAYNKTVGANSGQGAVYVYTRSGTTWAQEAKLVASDGAAGDNFGLSLAANDNASRIVIGAYQKAVNGNTIQGAAYIFARSGTTWTQEAAMSASDGQANDYFGYGTAISADGSRVSIGTYHSTNGAYTNCGAVYSYVRSGSVWTEVAKTIPADASLYDFFGFGLACDATMSRLAIGSYGKTISGNANQGQVYIENFSLFSSALSPIKEEAKLIATDGGTGDFFGYATAMSADVTRIVVSAHYNTYSGITNAGAAYVFVRNGATWSLEQKLTASDAATSDSFGFSVDMSADGTRVVIGAYNKTVGANANQGASYIFVRTGTAWTQEAKLVASDGAAGDNFGVGVAIDSTGLRVIIGAYSADLPSNPNCGAAYVFSRSGTIWTQEQKLTASDFAASAVFGRTVDIDSTGARVAIGSRDATVSGFAAAGAAYIFSRSGSTWSQEQKLVASDPAASDKFSQSVSLNSDASRIVVGAYQKNGALGAAYVFSRSGTTWTQEAKLLPSDPNTNDYFGSGASMNADGTRVAIGSYLSDPSGVTDAGAVYIFSRNGTSWYQEAKVTASDAAPSDYLGTSPKFDATGSRMVVGAYGKAVGSNNAQGAVYIKSR